jgi:hypothetical protein
LGAFTIAANQFAEDERDQVLVVRNSAEFVDRIPLQVYAVLLARGEYLCSVSTYRILAANALVGPPSPGLPSGQGSS